MKFARQDELLHAYSHIWGSWLHPRTKYLVFLIEDVSIRERYDDFAVVKNCICVRPRILFRLIAGSEED